jgi:hypothetical protein
MLIITIYFLIFVKKFLKIKCVFNDLIEPLLYFLVHGKKLKICVYVKFYFFLHFLKKNYFFEIIQKI